MAARYDLVINQGESFSFVATWKDSAGVVKDLTGYTARMHVRLKVEDAAFLVELTTGNGRIALGGALGTVTLTLDEATTKLLSWDGLAVYDIELVSGAGSVKRLLEGNVALREEVTR